MLAFPVESIGTEGRSSKNNICSIVRGEVSRYESLTLSEFFDFETLKQIQWSRLGQKDAVQKAILVPLSVVRWADKKF